MHDFSELDPDHLAVYLAGEASPEIAATVERWVAASPDRKLLFEDLRQGLRVIDGATPSVSFDIDAFCREVITRIEGSDASQREGASPARPYSEPAARYGMVPAWISSPAVRRLAGLLGGAALCVGVVVFAWRQPSAGRGITRTYTTASNQRAAVTLDDGTQVTLAPNTTLRLDRFGAQSRNVVLDGEAFFQVTRAEAAPFTVRTGDFATRVLGTGFLVRYSNTSSRLHVAVTDGKVAVSSSRSANLVGTLTAGHVGDILDSIVKTSSVDDPTPETGWRHDELVFRDAPVSSVLSALGRWYGYAFLIKDSTLARSRVTMGFSTQSSADAFASLETTLKVNVTVSGDTVTLTPVRSIRAPKGQNRKYEVWTPMREVGR